MFEDWLDNKYRFGVYPEFNQNQDCLGTSGKDKKGRIKPAGLKLPD